MKCEGCPNEIACKMANKNPFNIIKPRYGLMRVKSQVLQTFEENGTKGLKEFMEIDIW